MSPFTVDSKAITTILDSKNGLFNILSGPIISINRISSESNSQRDGNNTITDKFEIQTQKPSNHADTESKEICILLVEIITKYNFMEIIGQPIVTYGKPIIK